MIFRDLTLEQLRATTKEQIITKINDKLTSLTKKQIVEFIWGVKNVLTENLTLTELKQMKNSKNGQLLRVHETTDVLGKKLGSQKTQWTYYPTGEVDTIKISELDANDQVISTKTIKHFTDGRQPVILV